MWEIWGNYLVPKALKVAQSQKNRPIWSHWLLLKSLYGLLMNIARFQLHFQVKQWRMLWQKSARTSGLEKSLSRFVQYWWVHYLSYSILHIWNEGYSVTRFGEFSPLWHNYGSLGQNFEGLFCIWHSEFKNIYFWATFHSFGWPNTLK